MEENTKGIPALTARQQQLMIELVRSSDLQAACKRAGVGRTTAYRWLEQPGFADELSRQRSAAMNTALSALKALTTRAAEELSRLLDTQDERLRRHICKDILGHAIKVREIEEIERRLNRIEQRMNAETKGIEP